jgi:hypothetical protein
MKIKNLLSILALATMMVTVASCRKDKADRIDEIETTFELSENQAVTDNLTQDAGDVLEEAGAKENLLGSDGAAAICGVPTPAWIGSCAIVSVTGNFPSKNIKIDFGSGCTSPNGITRKGIINIVLTDSIRKSGSKATITFDNYYVNQFKKEGIVVRTNTTVAGSNTRSHNRTVTDGKITSPIGKVWQHSSNINITQTAGVNTPCDLSDDIYLLEGTRTVTNTQGKTRSSATQTPLQKKRSCANIDQGVLKVQGTNHFALIDFGNGSCDNQATISIDGRTPRNIFLR